LVAGNEISEELGGAGMDQNTKRAFFQRFLVITEELEINLIAGNVESIEKYLDQRQEIIDQVTMFDREMNAGDSVTVTQSLRPLIKQALEKDRIVMELLNKRKSSIATELEKIKASRRMKQIYQKKGNTGYGYFFDQKIK